MQPRFVSVIVAFWIALAPACADDPLSRLVTGHFDTNSDGVIDLGEWQAGLDEAFDEIDANADGAITAEDLADFKVSLSRSMGEVAAAVVAVVMDKAIKAFDTDNTGRVSREQFVAGCVALFRKLDADNDGSVTVAELATLPALK